MAWSVMDWYGISTPVEVVAEKRVRFLGVSVLL
jgi:hypothetical protein